jgi:WXG100 family type VII secretion target
MSGAYGTQTDVMQKAAQQVQQVADEINAELRSLEGNLAPVAASWKGAAQQAFQQLMERIMQDAQKLTQALQGISESLDSSTKSYSEAEQNNASQIGQILQGLQ